MINKPLQQSILGFVVLVIHVLYSSGRPVLLLEILCHLTAKSNGTAGQVCCVGQSLTFVRQPQGEQLRGDFALDWVVSCCCCAHCECRQGERKRGVWAPLRGHLGKVTWRLARLLVGGLSRRHAARKRWRRRLKKGRRARRRRKRMMKRSAEGREERGSKGGERGERRGGGQGDKVLVGVMGKARQLWAGLQTDRQDGQTVRERGAVSERGMVSDGEAEVGRWKGGATHRK